MFWSSEELSCIKAVSLSWKDGTDTTHLTAPNSLALSALFVVVLVICRMQSGRRGEHEH